jgi:uncharacterized protein YceK
MRLILISIIVGICISGCVDVRRKVVIDPDQVQQLNDSKWTIKSEPNPA